MVVDKNMPSQSLDVVKNDLPFEQESEVFPGDDVAVLALVIIAVLVLEIWLQENPTGRLQE